MTLNLIDNKMVVRNTVELQPEHTFVSASIECKDLKSYNVEDLGSGVYGRLDSKNLKLKKSVYENSNQEEISLSKTFLIGKDFDRQTELGETLIQTLNNTKSNINNKSQEDIENELKNYGILVDNSDSFKFGVEKVKQKYLVDDSNFYKKNSIKNLYNFYRENMQHRVLDPKWGFANYNCINFFNIYNRKNTNRTHRNCISYANPQFNNSYNYPFLEDKKNLTISFYINQNNKNKNGYHFNPGCVFFIEGIIGIYIVKGSSVDKSGLTDAYRIMVVYGDKVHTSRKNRVIEFLNDNIDNENEVIFSGNDIEERIGIYLSKDNIIKYNNWHNVLLNIEVSNASEDNVDYINSNLFIDGNKISENDTLTLTSLLPSELQYQINDKNFITIGNKYNTDNSQDLYSKMFSNNLLSDNDHEGAFVNKSISFGKDIENNYFENSFNETDFNLDNQLKTEDQDYVDGNTSFALSAEIHDIRVYNTIINENSIKNIICKNSIRNFNFDNLLFSLPVYYYDQDIKKKSIVNLNNINTRSNIGDINLANCIHYGPVNVFYSNKANGHEVITEKFLYEFKKKSSPNIIINNDITSNQTTYNLLNIASDDLTNPDSFINNSIKKGLSINSVYNKKLYDLEDIEIEEDLDFYYENYMAYNNNLIMPCDNGLQIQHRKDIEGYYDSNNSLEIHTNENNEYDLDFISLINLFNDELSLESNNFFLDITNRDLFDYTQSLNSLKDVVNRNNFIVNNNVSFKENYDNYKNISLNNYFREDFALSSVDQDEFLKFKSIVESSSSLVASRGNYLKDLSNPVARKINDDYSNSLANNIAEIGTKNLGDDNFIGYFKFELPMYNLYDTKSETFSTSLCVSTQIFGRKIERESVEVFDSDLAGTFGCKKVKLKDNGKGVLYRADALTEHALWNYSGHVLYKEGIITILHPSLENFSENGYMLKFRSSSKLNVLELNLPAYVGKTNKSRNTSKIDNLRLDESYYNSDEDFVYISDINLHDENLNIVAKAKIVKPFAKKDSDGVLFRLKMDF
jgi:hypothetical protein